MREDINQFAPTLTIEKQLNKKKSPSRNQAVYTSYP
jgi:hypothetical protein